MDRMVNYIWLAWNLACMLRTYRICNSTVEFSKYEFNNKLLSDVTLFRFTLSVTWTKLYIYIYIYEINSSYIYKYIYSWVQVTPSVTL